SEDNLDYAKRVMDVLVQRGIRTEIDPSGETLSKRIKRGYDDGVPYLVIVGRKEASEEKVTIRTRGNVEIKGVPLSRFVDELSLEIRNRDAENTLIKRIG
ncbi:MAG: His/Gly/Thr/Pro-type tRNA ligase C-terminal domain-containing protein, partial [Metallosphaera sp.]